MAPVLIARGGYESLGGQTQEPNAALKQLKQVIAKLKNDKESDTVKMTEKNDAYLLELSINEKKIRRFAIYSKADESNHGIPAGTVGHPADWIRLK